MSRRLLPGRVVRRLGCAVLVAVGLVPLPAAAGPEEGGTFVARDACPAYRSKAARTNPGDLALTPGQAYRALERNAVGGDWVRIRVPGAPEIEERWVALRCGTLAGGEAPPEVAPRAAQRGVEATDNVLAANWQPAFCEAQPRTPECRTLNRRRPSAAGFSLHGLWPQGDRGADPEYCDASARASVRRLDAADRWDELPPVPLDAELRRRLAVAMPGTASHLDRHEWHKHGSCFRDPAGADGYFADAMRLLDELNASPVGAFVAANAGERVARADLEAAFDAAFGAGTSRKVRLSCRRDGERDLLAEVVVPLGGRIEDGVSLGALVAAARHAGGRDTCPERFAIDPAGLQ